MEMTLQEDDIYKTTARIEEGAVDLKQVNCQTEEVSEVTLTGDEVAHLHALFVLNQMMEDQIVREQLTDELQDRGHTPQV